MASGLGVEESYGYTWTQHHASYEILCPYFRLSTRKVCKYPHLICKPVKTQRKHLLAKQNRNLSSVRWRDCSPLLVWGPKVFHTFQRTTKTVFSVKPFYWQQYLYVLIWNFGEAFLGTRIHQKSSLWLDPAGTWFCFRKLLEIWTLASQPKSKVTSYSAI